MDRTKALTLARAIFLAIVFMSGVLSAQAMSPRNANYDIKVKLLPEDKILEASETIRWRNISNISTDELQFHLYYNAFSHPKTTFMTESGGQLRGDRFVPAKIGWIRINSVNMGDNDLTESLEYIRPDDGNPHDSTVIRLKLPEPVNPGEEIELNLDFTAKSPRVFARSGYAEIKKRDMTFFMVGQWFPKLGVLEDDGWNCHQYHGSTEFFSDFGVYNVAISVPDEFVVGASGKLISTEKDSTYRTDTYRAEDVHDFSWTAYPGFEVLEDSLDHTFIRLLYNPDEQKYVEDQMDGLKRGMQLANEKIGIYPYSTLTVVNPPEGASGAGGMEYPTLITAGIIPGLPPSMPFKYHMVTIHEYGHQYFYGMVASNEFEHSWMDEGFTTFFEDYIMDNLFESNFPDILPVFKSRDMARAGYKAQPRSFTLMDTMYLQRRSSTYGINAYYKPGTLLNSMMYYLGEDHFFHFLSTYFSEWRFRHPYPEDLFEVMQRTTEEDISWFIEDYFKSEKDLDYRVDRVRSYELKEIDDFYPLSYFVQFDSVDYKDTTATYYKNYLSIANDGNGRFPFTVVATLSDSSELDLSGYFDGLSGKRFQQLEFITKQELKAVHIDPEHKIRLDLNWINNSWVKKDEKPAAKYVDFLKHFTTAIVQLVAGI